MKPDVTICVIYLRRNRNLSGYFRTPELFERKSIAGHRVDPERWPRFHGDYRRLVQVAMTKYELSLFMVARRPPWVAW